MTHLRVKLISYTPDPERVVCAAARICYSARDPLEVFENMGPEEIARTIRVVKQKGHLSVLEHANFTFVIDGCSRVCTHQLVRHRIASYSQRSQRYVKESGEDYVTPQTLEQDDEALKLYREHLSRSYELYTRLLGRGVPKEDARFVLPQSTATTIMVTMNARELLHFFGLRTCHRAQWEIRDVAARMLEQVKTVAPVLFEDAGPRCLSLGYCPEGYEECYQEVLKRWKQ
ncbi:FAD-dependent thymidylate synthase [Coprothermobacteraceae bacterium]|nr:FAD-dependent thymidylate synthase [Coprothermobacteraceae bacterium]